jgi:hypothetical protein
VLKISTFKVLINKGKRRTVSRPATPTTKILSTNVGGIFYFFVFELAQKDKKIKNNSERSSKGFGEQLTQIQDHEIILLAQKDKKIKNNSERRSRDFKISYSILK